VVDLDGTLLRTDLLLESALLLIKRKPWFALLMPLWLLLSFAFFPFLSVWPSGSAPRLIQHHQDDRKIRAGLECPRGWDWSARYSNNEMLVESYEWYLANRGAVLANTGGASHHQSTVEQGALKLLHWFL
jgi:hypothetical protein